MRLIDADTLKRAFAKEFDLDNLFGVGMGYISIMQEINESPTIDAIPVVRCKDCTYWQDQKEGVVEVPICKYDCRWDKKGVVIVMGAYDYCSHGEKKEDGVDR